MTYGNHSSETVMSPGNSALTETDTLNWKSGNCNNLSLRPTMAINLDRNSLKNVDCYGALKMSEHICMPVEE